MTLIIAAVAVVLLAIIALIAYSRRPRQDAGLTSFRRHIDALSPESRREVKDRVRPSLDADDDEFDHSGDAASGDDPQEPTD